MMINKRLIATVGSSKKYIAGNAVTQWLSMIFNIVHVAMNGMAASDKIFRSIDFPESEPRSAEISPEKMRY